MSSYQLVLRPPQNRFGWWGTGTITIAALAFLYWAAVGSQINGTNLWNGIPYMWDFLVRMTLPFFGWSSPLVPVWASMPKPERRFRLRR